MSKLVILGGTGFAGTHIAREAAARGWDVVAVARHVPTDPLPGVTYAEADVSDRTDVAHLVHGADVVGLALRASLPTAAGPLEAQVPAILAAVADAGARLGVVGGAGSSLVSPDGPRLLDTPDFPAAYRPEALAHAAVLAALQADPSDTDWFYVSPAAEFGAEAGVEPRGTYRSDGDVLVVADDGSSRIAGEDLARAFVDEAETPAHHRARFTVGY